MSPHEKVAFTGALKAAAAALDDEARVEFVKWAQEQKKATGADRFSPTLGGTVTVAGGGESIKLDPDALLAWMLEHQPHNVEVIPERRVVRPAAEKALLKDLRIVAGSVVREVVDEATGEVKFEDFEAAFVVPGRSPYPSWRGGDAVKQQATEWLRGRYEAVAELLTADRKAVES